MKSTFSEKNGYKLIFDDAQQKQENQITAIRNFIQQDVDYIVLAPVTETGWDTVLKEAKDADIPVIIVDRTVFGVLIKGTISSLITTQGTLSSWWVRIALSALLCFFIVLQSIIGSMKKKN